eukprot:3463661-Prorocentrum_lima.AAC.1
MDEIQYEDRNLQGPCLLPDVPPGMIADLDETVDDIVAPAVRLRADDLPVDPEVPDAVETETAADAGD